MDSHESADSPDALCDWQAAFNSFSPSVASLSGPANCTKSCVERRARLLARASRLSLRDACTLPHDVLLLVGRLVGPRDEHVAALDEDHALAGVGVPYLVFRGPDRVALVRDLRAASLYVDLSRVRPKSIPKTTPPKSESGISAQFVPACWRHARTSARR